MKLSEFTQKILKNVSEINGSLVILKSELEDGTELKCVNKEKSMQLHAVVPEKFENSVYIYDLNSFLAAASAMPDADVAFGAESLVISDGKSKVRMGYASPETIIYETRTMKANDVLVKFEVSEQNMSKILKFADILSLPELRLYVNADSKLVFEAYDRNNPSTNTYQVDLGDYTGDASFEEAILKREMLKLIPGDYEIAVASRLAVFTNLASAGNLRYTIGLVNKG